MPTFAADAPLYLYGIPEEERKHRCVLQSDTCVIDDKLFFIRGCIEIPVDGASEPFIWGVWVSLSAQSFVRIRPAAQAGAIVCREALRQQRRP